MLQWAVTPAGPIMDLGWRFALVEKKRRRRRGVGRLEARGALARSATHGRADQTILGH